MIVHPGHEPVVLLPREAAVTLPGRGVRAGLSILVQGAGVPGCVVHGQSLLVSGHARRRARGEIVSRGRVPGLRCEPRDETHLGVARSLRLTLNPPRW